jgi:AraC-like DNA-binding protein
MNELEQTLTDLRRVSPVPFCVKPAAPEWKSRLSIDSVQHRCATCREVKQDPDRLRICMEEDDGWAQVPRREAEERVCPFGVREWRIPVWHRGEYLGCVFAGAAGPGEAPADPEGCHALGRLIADQMAHCRDQAWEQDLMRRSASDQAVARAVEWIRDQRRVNIRVPEAAGQVHLSPSRFLHRFHDCMGMGFGECVRHLVMERALQLVTGTDLKIVEIALELGYANQNHFAQHFKAAHGCTATEARRKARASGESSTG